MSYDASLDRKHIEAFKAKWPCHGLPDSLNRLYFVFETNGDLVDIIAKSRNGRTLNSADFDGPAMVALCEDAQRRVHPDHADLRYGKREAE